VSCLRGLRGSLAGLDFADDEISGHVVQVLGKLKPQKARTHVERVGLSSAGVGPEGSQRLLTKLNNLYKRLLESPRTLWFAAILD